MTAPPSRPKIYHITHVNNLPAIIDRGGLLADAAIARHGGPSSGIGMAGIKGRRLKLPVKCYPDTSVGEYVPFYFCPRSVMLYLLHRGNHPDVSYDGGQGPIVHLEADLQTVVSWAEGGGRRWAFTLSNAGAFYAEFRGNLAELHGLNWSAIRATDFRQADVKEGKQAEFLMHEFFAWTLVTRIGVCSQATKKAVEAALAVAAHVPVVQVQPAWYY